jgi:ferric-dicitrate binding protein FerR (iron transport regulator)
MAKVNMMSSNVKLLLSSDSVLSIESQTPQIQYASNKVTIDKSIASGEISEDSYNQLIVPYGHRSQLTLTDGTKIWLNSGTRLVYPEKFSGKNREIYVEGEIYLEVRHDADHPFIVRSNNMDVQVLGTKFDVKTYLGEHLNRVVLLNGSVKVTQNDKFALLRPGYMYESQNGSPVVEQVDTYHYISWIYGFYEFESEKLSRIFAELEKYYNINIVCDKNAALLECSGKLNLNDNFQKVISSICETAPVDFQYNNGIYRVRLK